MSLQVKGAKELVDFFDRKCNIEVPNKALKSAGEKVLDIEKQVAKSTHNKYSTGKGAANIKKFPIRKYQGKTFIDIGLRENNATNWNEVKGLYFNHYGFYHNGYSSKGTRKNRRNEKFRPTYIAGSRWMDTAFEKSKDIAYKTIADEMLKEFSK